MVRYLSQLTQLQRLELFVTVPPDPWQGAFGLPDLVCLTALTGLGHLDARMFEEEEQGDGGGKWISMGLLSAWCSWSAG